ncbi:MAG: sugar phosphate isomerase/epimerase [Clostridia bacterium]|nr:sugar phosphate isomerase/epimerase [Clostridia bacterium]
MNFSMRGHDFDASSVKEVSEKCAKYGVYGVQLVMPKTIPDFKVGSFSPALAQKMKAELDENNVKIPVLGCYINPSCTNEDELRSQMNRFKEQLKYARFLDAHMVGTETGYVGDSCVPENNHTEEAYQHFLGNLKELVSCAEKLGVMIGIEGVKIFVINSPQKMRRMLDDVNSPNVLCIFDPVNFIGADNYMEQDKIIDDAFALYGEEMCAVHLKDFIIDEQGNMRRVLPTEGILNTRKILTYIKNNKPDMPVVLEEVKEHDLEKVMKNVQALYDSI